MHTNACEGERGRNQDSVSRSTTQGSIGDREGEVTHNHRPLRGVVDELRLGEVVWDFPLCHTEREDKSRRRVERQRDGRDKTRRDRRESRAHPMMATRYSQKTMIAAP